jgi:hypothetical protein
LNAELNALALEIMAIKIRSNDQIDGGAAVRASKPKSKLGGKTKETK